MEKELEELRYQNQRMGRELEKEVKRANAC